MSVIVRVLIRLYSADFRNTYGADAVRVLLEDLAEARSRGGARAVWGAASLLADFAVQGVADRAGRWLRRFGSDGSLAGGWGQDVRLAFRSALKRPGFVLVAVTSLTIGVGATTVVFTVVDSLLLREIPGVDDPDRVVELRVRGSDGRLHSWSFPDFVDARRETGLLRHAAMFNRGAMNLSEDDAGERIVAMYVTSGYFETFGAMPSRGRTFLAEEDVGPGQHPVVILSHATWRTRFHGDPDVLGSTLRLNREPYTVVGVAREDFLGHQFGLQPAVYVPLTQYPPLRDAPERFAESRGTSWGEVVGRVDPGVDVEALNDELDAVFARLEAANAVTNEGRSARAFRAALVPAEGRRIMGVVFAMLGVLMLLVLAATCANVGGMLLARASAQERDMAVRLALGSGRGRLVRLLLFEAMVIFGVGGAGGVFFATQGLRLFDANRFLPTPFPIELDFSLDWRVLTFGLVLTIGTGVVFGLIPALQVTRDHLADTLRDQAAGNSRRAGRLRRVFVGGQVGVAILLLASAGLFLRSLQSGFDSEPRFTPDGVYMAQFNLDMEGYGDPAEAEVFVARLLEHLRSRPWITNATVATDFPLDGASSSTPVWPDGNTAEESVRIQSYFAKVSEGYFETLEIEVLAGRAFADGDGRLTPRVAVVNQVFADAAWPDGDPIGRVVEFGLESETYTVIGVVADTRTDMVTDRLSPQVFSLLAQDYGASVGIAVRAAQPTPEFAGRMRREVLAVDPALALGTVRTLDSLAGLGTLPSRLAAAVATVLGLLALFLSAVGVYGIVAFSVTQRTREIGVRIALGASRRQVMARVVRGGLALALPGFVVGTLVAVALGHVFRAVFVGVHPLDPLAYGAVAVTLVVVITMASFVPGRRASGIEPMDALRSE